jgi:hypothetical protein
MNKFRYYYEIAEEIFSQLPNSFLEKEGDVPPANAAPTTDAAPEADPNPQTGNTNATSTPSSSEPQKITSDMKDKVDKTKLIKIDSDNANEQLLTSVNELIITIFEKKEKVKTIEDIIKFLDDIDYTSPKKYDDQFKFKKINTFLTSKEYSNLSPTNLYGIYNALQESYILLKKNYMEKKEKDKLQDLEEIYTKMSRANFEKNINSLAKKIVNIKKNLNNVNQIFSLQGYESFFSETKDMINKVQKNSTEFIKKLS